MFTFLDEASQRSIFWRVSAARPQSWMRTAHIEKTQVQLREARDLLSSSFYLPAWDGSRVGNKSSFETKTLRAGAVRRKEPPWAERRQDKRMQKQTLSIHQVEHGGYCCVHSSLMHCSIWWKVDSGERWSKYLSQEAVRALFTVQKWIQSCTVKRTTSKLQWPGGSSSSSLAVDVQWGHDCQPLLSFFKSCRWKLSDFKAGHLQETSKSFPFPPPWLVQLLLLSARWGSCHHEFFFWEWPLANCSCGWERGQVPMGSTEIALGAIKAEQSITAAQPLCLL